LKSFQACAPTTPTIPPDYGQELELPNDLHGFSLADIGASNGYFSFAARQRGARVVAFDFRHKDNSGLGLGQYINGT
jgi:2-polyprenyl-3-methyl-5-hydroxy-6-metoxy-1,4-benzoquinol methylase